MIILVCPICDSKFKVKADALGEKGRLVKCAKCQHKWHATANGDNVAPAPTPAPAPAPTPAPAPAPTPAPTSDPKPEAVETESTLESIVGGAFDDDAINEEASLDPSVPSFDTDDSPLMNPDTEDMEDFGAFAPPSDPPPIAPDFRNESDAEMETRSPLKAWIVLFILLVIAGLCLNFFSKQIIDAYPPAYKIYKLIGMNIETLGYGLEIKTATLEPKVSDDTVSLLVKGNIENVTSEIISVPLLIGTLKDTKGNALHSWTFNASESTVLPGEMVAYETNIVSPPRGATNFSVSFTTEEEAMANGDAMDDADKKDSDMQAGEKEAPKE